MERDQALGQIVLSTLYHVWRENGAALNQATYEELSNRLHRLPNQEELTVMMSFSGVMDNTDSHIIFTLDQFLQMVNPSSGRQLQSSSFRLSEILVLSGDLETRLNPDHANSELRSVRLTRMSPVS